MATPEINLDERLRRLREIQKAKSAGMGVAPMPVGGLMGGATAQDSPSLAQLELNKTLSGAQRRILSDPVVARSTDPSKLIADLERISQGQNYDSGGGIVGAFGKGVGQFLGGIGYAASRPLALATSAAKETMDIASGGFSVEDFVKQALAKDTAPSKYISKTGVNWIDNIIGFTADVILDPLTYVTFGANQFTGRAGRLILAAKAAEAENLLKAPTLLKKIEDGSIAKLGEWALDAHERAVLGVRPGLSWSFGKGGTIGREGTLAGKLSEGAATIVGKPLAKVRGAIGSAELPGIVGLQKFTTPKKVRIAGLEMYGRAVEDPATVNRVADLASLSAGVHGNAAGSFVEKKFGSSGQALAKKVFDYEQATGRRIYEVLENVRPAADAAEQQLANETRKFLNDMREYANTATEQFAKKRGVQAFGIAHRENYAPHTLTAEARKYVMNQGLAGTSSASAIKQMFGMNVQEFTKGPGVLRGRKLMGRRIDENGVVIPGQKFMDVELKTNTGDGSATMREINDISMDKLGFKWFEEDGAQYLSNYLDSIVNQTKRVAFVDRLFDYGGSVVKSLTSDKMPNTAMAKQWEKIIDGYDNLIVPVLSRLAGEAGEMGNVLTPRIQLAQALLDLKPGSRILTDEDLSGIKKILDATMKEYSKGVNLLRKSPEEISDYYWDLMDNIESSMDSIRVALEAGDEQELIAQLGLRETYARLLPEREIPADFKTMAEDILDAVEVYFSDDFLSFPRRLSPPKDWVDPEKDADDIEGIIETFTRGPTEINVGFPEEVANNLDALTKFLQNASVPNTTQLFRGASQNPIFDIFKDQQFPGKPLSFSESAEVAENFPSNIYTYEPGELRGIPIDVYSRYRGEEEWLVDPYSIVEATAKGFNPEQARKLKDQLEQLTKRFSATKEEADSMYALAYAFDSKVKSDRAALARNSIESLEKEIEDLTKDVPIGGQASEELAAEVSKRELEIRKLTIQADAAETLAQQKQSWEIWFERKQYGDDIKKISNMLKKNPPPGTAGEATALWATKTRDVLRSLKDNTLRLSPEEAEVVDRVVLQMKSLESRLAMLEGGRTKAVETYNKIVSGEVASQVSRDVIKGWQAIESMGIQMPPDIRDRMFAKVAELGTPEGASTMRKMYDQYTRFFKVTAMLSPGFIVRNSYTAAFNNFVAGVSLKETRDAMRFATDLWRNGLDVALSKVPKESRDLYKRALEVAYSTGAGQTYDDILAPIMGKGGSKFMNLKPVKKWSEANETAEVAFRFALGLSSLNKGMDFDSAVGMVSRYHFDYTDLSKLDEVARRFIPFWIFASRNIPLQIVNSIARPSVYRMYESVQRNYGLSEEEMADYPEWMRNRLPLRLPGMGADQTLMPDLPQLDMREQINMMSDPLRLMSQANPLIKLPIELAGNRQLWNSVPFSEKKSPVRGPFDLPAYVIDSILGRAGKSPATGERYTSSKTAYAIPNLIPTLGQLQRVLPKIPFTGIELGGKEQYQSRQGSSFAGYVGLPYRRVSEEEKFNELTRRQFAIRDYLSELTRRGQLNPRE